MWEKLFELALFVRSGARHRKPSEILKTFIKIPDAQQEKLSKQEKQKLTQAFTFLENAYKKSLAESRLATDQTHFYTLATSLLTGELLASFDVDVLTRKLINFGKILDGKTPVPSDEELAQSIKRYQALSKEKTTDATRREERQQEFIHIVTVLPGTEQNAQQIPLLGTNGC